MHVGTDGKEIPQIKRRGDRTPRDSSCTSIVRGWCVYAVKNAPAEDRECRSLSLTKEACGDVAHVSLFQLVVLAAHLVDADVFK
jgi:hypothetical protein